MREQRRLCELGIDATSDSGGVAPSLTLARQPFLTPSFFLCMEDAIFSVLERQTLAGCHTTQRQLASIAPCIYFPHGWYCNLCDCLDLYTRKPKDPQRACVRLSSLTIHVCYGVSSLFQVSDTIIRLMLLFTLGHVARKRGPRFFQSKRRWMS